MKIFLTGGTGFVGTQLTSRLLREGHSVTILTRSLKVGEITQPHIFYLEGDPTKKGAWQAKIKDHDAVINLAGASIFARWTEEHKQAIRDSRIITTRNIVEGIPLRDNQSFTFFSTSAVGYYGFHEDEELSEDSPPGNDFLAQVARDWEEEAWRAREKGARVVITRFGIVLGEKGGALGQIVPLFKKYLGGPIGSGNQWFSWIHIKDLAEAFIFLINHPSLSGPFNFCSPNPVRNKELAKTLGKILKRPSFIPAPGLLVKLFLGEFSSIILKGQKVIPRRLLDNGFQFQYPQLEKALQDIAF
ncbi:MAG: TIGR01777 family oxidoreductase [Thermodesulfobacteriota bacterium]